MFRTVGLYFLITKFHIQVLYNHAVTIQGGYLHVLYVLSIETSVVRKDHNIDYAIKYTGMAGHATATYSLCKKVY